MVLDSEDEGDDDFDTQSSWSEQDDDVEALGIRTTSSNALDITDGTDSAPKQTENAKAALAPLKEQDPPENEGQSTTKRDECAAGSEKSRRGLLESSPENDTRQELASEPTRPVTKATATSQSTPDELPSLSQLVADPPLQAPESGVGEIEEVSRTYVRLSSATPSLSSIDSVQLEQLQASDTDTRNDRVVIEREAPIVDEVAASETAPVQENQHSPPRRSFRPRTSIQLHPYLIEGEKHRNQFRGAHIAPLRITHSSQEHETKRRNAQNEDSQDTEFEAEGESQESDIQSESQDADILAELLSSPSRRLSPIAEDEELQTPRQGVQRESQDDDELPDITDIVKTLGAPGSRQLGRARTYGKAHAKAKKTSNIVTGTSSRAFTDVFDVPDSPPLTSPSKRGSLEVVIDNSKETPIATHQARKAFVNPRAQYIDLPTPAASSAVQRRIEEVMPQFEEPIERLPPFLRIAARSAGSRHAIGRQGPAQKFVRLDNREATAEAQSVLRQWRGRSPVHRAAPKAKRAPLRDVSRTTGNIRRNAAPSTKLPRPRPLAATRIPRVVKQTRIIWPVKEEDSKDLVQIKAEPGAQQLPPKKRVKIRRGPRPIVSRSAQLEITETEYGARDRRAALDHTKRNLDRGYRRYRNGADGMNHLLLSRFLDDGDGGASRHDGSRAETSGALLTPHQIASTMRRRKRQPMHIDAEIAKYRQPETVMDTIEVTPTTNIERLFDDHLHGLGGPTAVYSIDFDIKPLRSDVYFHEATFIGQGRLSKALQLDAGTCLGRRQQPTSTYSLKGKDLKWTAWLDTVSIDIQACFNWIIERVEVFANIDDEILDLETVKCLLFVVGYFQESLSTNTSSELSRCIEFMIEPIQGLLECLEVLTSDLAVEDNVNNRRVLSLATYTAVLASQLLRLASTNTFSLQRDPILKLEGILQRATAITVKLLFIIGLSPLDDLYEDLRQEAFRQGGIREDHHPAQAWIIIMHLVQAAKIPRFSVWNAVNDRLLTNIDFQTDAKVIEQAWRSMFSLLPLLEFDKLGILRSRARYRETFDNWALPQKLIKRVFDLYSPNLENLSSYTNYCKAIFNRCHHLIQVWGWRRYGSILGTLFDFFATHKFSDISGHKADTQREFLTDLDGALSSFVVKEDQCFHVFLKILHSATRQLREAGDAKEIRNLVTRLLPNQELQQGDGRIDEGSLKNHHDLLYTLYWAAPMELKQKIKDMLDAVERKRREGERPGSRSNGGLRANAFAYMRRV